MTALTEAEKGHGFPCGSLGVPTKSMITLVVSQNEARSKVSQAAGVNSNAERVTYQARTRP